MRTIWGFLSLCLFGIYACGKSNSEQGIKSYLIDPVKTDARYLSNENSHFVVFNEKTHLNKLLLFIGGSYSSPKDYSIFCSHAASIGFDVISLSYPNNVATAPLGGSSNQHVFDTYRQEICFGTPVSDVVDVDSLNSIVTRAAKLIQYLKNTYPNQNWGQYLTSENKINWSKIALAGHSQGSGHACYLGKQNLVDRVIMLSGPNDFSSYFDDAANWLNPN